MHLEECAKAAGLLLASIVLTAVWWMFFHTPMQAAMDRWQAEGRKTHAQLIDVQNYKNEGEGLAARQKEQEKRHSFLAAALPDELRQGAFLQNLERVALAHHLELRSVKPGEVLMREDGLRELPLHVAVRGDYFSLRAFLQALETQEAGGRFVLVRGLTVEVGEAGEPLKAVLILSIFACGANGAESGGS